MHGMRKYANSCNVYVLLVAFPAARRNYSGTGSMKRYGVRPSVRPSAADLLLWAGGQEILIDCCSSGVRLANASSATLSAYVGS